MTMSEVSGFAAVSVGGLPRPVGVERQSPALAMSVRRLDLPFPDAAYECQGAPGGVAAALEVGLARAPPWRTCRTTRCDGGLDHEGARGRHPLDNGRPCEGPGPTQGGDQGAWGLFSENIIREAYATDDPARVIFILEVDTLAAAERRLSALPLVANGSFTVQLSELRPFANWQMLFSAGWNVSASASDL